MKFKLSLWLTNRVTILKSEEDDFGTANFTEIQIAKDSKISKWKCQTPDVVRANA